MNLEDLLSPEIRRKVELGGESALFVVSLLLALDYFKVFDLTRINGIIPFVLWGYLLLNIGLVNIFKYLRNKSNPICPKCNRKLNEIKDYECSNCGKLNYQKQV